MQKLIKIKAYDKCIDEFEETFINPEKICFLTVLDVDGKNYFMVYFGDLALRVTPNSYAKLVRILYGEDYDLQAP